MKSGPRSIESQLLRAQQRMAQLRARELLHEQRRESRRKDKARRAEMSRREDLADAIVRNGLSDWDTATLIGALLYGKQRALESQTARLAMRKKGEEFTRTGGKSALFKSDIQLKDVAELRREREQGT